jgi:hypothetical protein
MVSTIDPNTLGMPDLQLGQFEIWIHGRQFPEATDYWDGNWLMVTVRCQTQLATVWTAGPIMHLSELANWIKSTEQMVNTLTGEANLVCMEPELGVEMKMDKLGHVRVKVKITSDSPKGHHVLNFEIDQSHLPDFVRDGRRVIAQFPIIGKA